MNTRDEVMTVEEVAAYLKLDPKTVRQYARNRVIPARKLGNQWRFMRSALEEWLRAEYAVIEQKPAGVVTSENNICRYSNEVIRTGSTFGTMDAEYENLLEL